MENGLGRTVELNLGLEKSGNFILSGKMATLHGRNHWYTRRLLFFVVITAANNRCMVERFHLKADFLSSQKPLAAS